MFQKKGPKSKVIALCFEILGQSQPSCARFLPAPLLQHQELCSEALGRTLGASVVGVAGSLFDTGLWEMEQWVSAPLTTGGHPFWPCGIPQEAPLGPSSWIQHAGSPQIWHSFHTTVNLRQIMMQPVTQPISIIIGKKIAKGSPWAVGDQKEIFSSN